MSSIFANIQGEGVEPTPVVGGVSYQDSGNIPDNSS
jgi:hypothetical protein